MDARNTILDALDALRLTAESEAIDPILKDLNSYFINLDRVIESLMPLTQDNARLRPIVKMYTLKECQEDYIIGEYKIWFVSAECMEDIYENKIDVHDGDTIPNDNRYKELCLRIGHSKTDVYAFSRLLFFNKPYQENGMYYVRNDFWEKVKRPAGYFFVIIGLAFIISAFLNSIVSFILMIILIVCAILTTIYSLYLFYKNRK